MNDVELLWLIGEEWSTDLKRRSEADILELVDNLSL